MIFLRLLSLVLPLAFASAAVAQTGPTSHSFGIVKLGTTAGTTLTIKGEFASWYATVSLEGHGYQAPTNVEVSIEGDLAVVTIPLLFTPSTANSEAGKLTISTPKWTHVVELSGQGDTNTPSGIYYITDAPTFDRLNYPADLKRSFTISNASFSNDSLRIGITEKPDFLSIFGPGRYVLAPDSTIEIGYSIDSNREGFLSDRLIISLNSPTRSTITIPVRANLPRRARIGSLALKDSIDKPGEIRTLTFTNTGDRELTAVLPELQFPFEWVDDIRDVSLDAFERAQVKYTLVSAVRDTLVHSYWIQTNAVNVPDSILIQLKAFPLKSDVVSVERKPVLSFDGRWLRSGVIDNNSLIEVFDLLGRTYFTRSMQPYDLLDLGLLAPGHYLVVLRGQNLNPTLKILR